MKKVTETKPANQKPAEKLKLPMKPILAALAVLFIVIVLLIAEAVNMNRYSVKNNTGTDIESVVVYFENENEEYSFTGDELFVLSVPAGGKKTGSYEKQDSMYLAGSAMMIRVKFAGRDTAYLYSGYFTHAFNGKINLVFEDDKNNEGNIIVKIKAGEGLFMSTKNTNCDENWDLFLDE